MGSQNTKLEAGYSWCPVEGDLSRQDLAAESREGQDRANFTHVGDHHFLDGEGEGEALSQGVRTDSEFTVDADFGGLLFIEDCLAIAMEQG